MNRVESCFLTALGCSVRGIPMPKAVSLSDEEWLQIFRLAEIHHVLPLVFEAVYSLPQLRSAPWFGALRQQVRQQVILQTRKTADFLRLLQELDAAEVRPLVVKGIVCRALYPKPDHRYSSDEDLLIRREDLDACRKVFARFGLSTDVPPAQQADSYEIPYRQAHGPLYIELHKSLFPPQSDSYGHLNGYFREAFSRCARIEVSGVAVPTLNPTDHLFYLICHALKHFLHSGFGLRQVCDILLFAKHYRDAIDWPLFLENCRRIHGLTFTASVFRIGYRHLGFPMEDCPEALVRPDVDEMPMLEDLLQAGIYGSSSQTRLHSSNITLEAMASSRQNRTARNELLLSLFPPARKLAGRYPYLKEKPWLLPAAWADRMGAYCRNSLSRKPSDGLDALKLGAQRTALLSFYGILDRE